MSLETVIGLSDQFAVEPLFAGTRLIPCDKQDRLPPGIESKRHSPLPRQPR
jgi:hypothetical protein